MGSPREREAAAFALIGQAKSDALLESGYGSASEGPPGPASVPLQSSFAAARGVIHRRELHRHA
jgi:hypothetical protein